LDTCEYFFHEWGCESRSNVSFGKYKLKQGNLIVFYFLPFDSIAAIKEVVNVNNASGNDSIVTISFYDRFGKSLNGNVGIQLLDTNNKVHEVGTDEKGQIQVNRFIYKTLIPLQVLTIYGKSEGIPIGKESINIYLNLPKLFFDYPELKLDETPNMILELGKKGLYNPATKGLVYKLE
jgi:hypothetical protein